MAFISQEVINEIKSKNDIVEVIGSYINLDEKNKACCPFHTEKTPSFSVQAEKQIYKCFGCGESGNVITFVQKKENISFVEAIKKLADRVNISLDISLPKKNSKYDKLYEINDTVCKFYKNNLLAGSGKEAIKYLEKRKIDSNIINEFNIGLSLNNSLSEILTKKYIVDDLIDIDVSKEINGKLYDTFQNRIVFPIIDEEKHVLGYSGRKYLDDDLNNPSLPKYLNTKDTVIFNKSFIFYNINNALQYINSKGEMIICEGQMDAIRVSSIGYKNVVSLMGTAFTKNHLDKILKYKCKVVLNLDQDGPGKNATINIGDILQSNGIDTSVIIFDDYKDSDEFIINKGKDAFDIAYNNKISFIDFKLKYLKNNRNMSDSIEKSKYVYEAIDSLNKIDDIVLKNLKVKDLVKETGIDESVIKSLLTDKNVKGVIDKINSKSEILHCKYNKYDISEIRLLYLMLHNEEVINIFESNLGYMIRNDRSNMAYKIIEFRNDYGYFEYSDFIDYISEDEKLNDVLKEVNKYPNNDEYTLCEIDSYIDTIKEHSVKNRISILKREMKDTLDINKKIEIAKKIEKINKEVLKW